MLLKNNLIGVMYWYIFLNREGGGHRSKKRKIKENKNISKSIDNNKSTHQNNDLSSLKMVDN